MWTPEEMHLNQHLCGLPPASRLEDRQVSSPGQGGAWVSPAPWSGQWSLHQHGIALDWMWQGEPCAVVHECPPPAGLGGGSALSVVLTADQSWAHLTAVSSLRAAHVWSGGPVWAPCEARHPFPAPPQRAGPHPIPLRQGLTPTPPNRQAPLPTKARPHPPPPSSTPRPPPPWCALGTQRVSSHLAGNPSPGAAPVQPVTQHPWRAQAEDSTESYISSLAGQHGPILGASDGNRLWVQKRACSRWLEMGI